MYYFNATIDIPWSLIVHIDYIRVTSLIIMKQTLAVEPIWYNSSKLITASSCRQHSPDVVKQIVLFHSKSYMDPRGRFWCHVDRWQLVGIHWRLAASIEDRSYLLFHSAWTSNTFLCLFELPSRRTDIVISRIPWRKSCGRSLHKMWYHRIPPLEKLLCNWPLEFAIVLQAGFQLVRPWLSTHHCNCSESIIHGKLYWPHEKWFTFSLLSANGSLKSYKLIESS